MFTDELKHGLFLKKSPFLVVKQLDNNEVRVYSKLHGNLSSFNFNINEIFNIFDPQSNIETAVKKISKIYRHDSGALIKELFEKQFLIESNKNEKDIFSEYVEKIKNKNTIPRITKVTFLISEKCNMACIGCYHNFFTFESPNMKSDFAGKMLEGLYPYLKKKKIPALLISFLGYEPFVNFETLRKIYDQACSMSEEYGIKTTFKIFTNGFSLNEKIFKWIEENKSKLGILVSLDGTKEDNDKRRVDFTGRGTYNRVIENLKRIISTDVECGVLIVLSKLNYSNIEIFVDEMAAIGIKHITANIFCGHSIDERLIELTEIEKFDAIKRMDVAAEKYDIEFDGEWKFAVVQMVTGAYFSCPAGIKQLVFSADGVIYPCQRFAGTKMNFGTHKGDFWDKIINGQCESYNNWTAELYDGVMDRAKEAETDLTGWSCPFLPFMRGECLSKNLDREMNEYLLEYYLTRPLNRIITKSPMNYGY